MLLPNEAKILNGAKRWMFWKSEKTKVGLASEFHWWYLQSFPHDSSLKGFIRIESSHLSFLLNYSSIFGNTLFVEIGNDLHGVRM